MTLLAIDPGRSPKGEASIGVAAFNLWDAGKELFRERVTFEYLVDHFLIEDGTGDLWYGDELLEEVIIENFVNNAKSRGGQTNGTSECIGAVEVLCRKTGTPFHRQEPAALGPAKLHAPRGSWKPLKHLRHEDAAYLHGYEYLVRTGRLLPAGFVATL